MHRLTALRKSINVLNGLLILAVAASTHYFVIPILNPEIRTVLPAVHPVERTPASLPESPGTPSFADYLMVSEKNLFHPERRIPPEKKEVTMEKPVIPKPDLILYGTLITDTLSIAYIEDRKAPYSTPGRGKRQTPLKKGESVGGYVLREIEPHRIVLTLGEEKLIVLLDIKDKKREGEALAAPPATAGAVSPPAATPAVPRTVAPMVPRVATPPAAIPRTMIPPPATAPVPARTGDPPPARVIPRRSR